jgi:phage replication-related protein YjqB (UPF0714/DUF867 family)
MKVSFSSNWKFLAFIALGTLAGCSSSPKPQTVAGEDDLFRNYAELSQTYREGVDFEIVSRDFPRGSRERPFVFAIHGGAIEPGTTELANAVAGKDAAFYSFVGKTTESRPKAEMLHLTATHFDEPRLEAMLPRANRCLSLHGFGGVESDFCVGGADVKARRALVVELRKRFPDWRACEICCPPYLGVAKKNVANRCGKPARPGVQIEMSPTVRKEIVEDSAFRERLAEVLRRRLGIR